MQSQEWLLTHPVRIVKAQLLIHAGHITAKISSQWCPATRAQRKNLGERYALLSSKWLLKPLFPACHRSTKVMKRPCQHSYQMHKKNDLEEQNKLSTLSGVKDFLHVRISSSKPFALVSWELFHIHSTCAEILLCQVDFTSERVFLCLEQTANRGLESSEAMVTHDWIITYSPVPLTHAPTYGLAFISPPHFSPSRKAKPQGPQGKQTSDSLRWCLQGKAEGVLVWESCSLSQDPELSIQRCSGEMQNL